MSQVQSNLPAGPPEPALQPSSDPVADVSDEESLSEEQEKAEALRFLKHMAGMMEGGDKERGLYKVGSKRVRIVAYRPEVAEERGYTSKETRYANRVVRYQLEALENVAMTPGDKALLNGVFNNLKKWKATTGDILRLHDLMEKVTQPQYQTKLAQDALARYAKQAKRHGIDKPLIWSDQKQFFEKETWRPWVSSARKQTGKQLAAAFRSVESVFSQDEPAVIIEFERLMDRLASGKMTTDELLDLHELVKRAEDPNAYARNTINKVSDLAKKAGPKDVVTWNKTAHDFTLLDRKDVRCRTPYEAGWRFSHRISGIEFQNDLTGVQAYDLACLQHCMENGKLQHSHYAYLQGLLDKEADPVQHAVDELNRLNAVAERAGDDKSITWRDRSLKVVMRNRFWMTSIGRQQAGERIAERLGALRSLLSEGSADRKKFDTLMSVIRSGEGKSTQIMELKKLIDGRGKKESVADAAAGPPAGPPVGPLSPGLLASGSSMRPESPAANEEYGLLTEHTRHGGATRKDIKELERLRSDSLTQWRENKQQRQQGTRDDASATETVDQDRPAGNELAIVLEDNEAGLDGSREQTDE